MTRRRAVGALFFANGTIVGTWVCRIPAVRTALGLSSAQIAVALLAAAAGALLAMPLCGVLSARWGTRRICAAAGLLCCSGLPALAAMPSMAALAAALFAFGVAHGALDVAMNAEAAGAEKQARRPIMASLHALFSAGGLAGAAGGGWLASQGFPPLWHFLMVAALCGGLIARAAPALPGGRSRAARVRPDRLPVRGSDPSTRRALALLGVIAFCSMIGEGSMADWSALFLRDVRGAGPGAAALGYAGFSLAMVAGRLGGDRLIGRWGPRLVLRLSGWAAAGGISLALLGPGTGAALAGFALAGAGFAAVVPIVFSAAAQHARGDGAAAAIASVATTGYFGFLAGPPLIGFVAQRFGLSGGLAVIAVTSASCALLAGAVGRGDESLTAVSLDRIPAPR